MFDNDDDHDDDEFVCDMTDKLKAFSLIFSQGHCHRFSSSRISNIARRIWTCAEPEIRFNWMKLCSIDNQLLHHDATLLGIVIQWPYYFSIFFRFHVFDLIQSCSCQFVVTIIWFWNWVKLDLKEFSWSLLFHLSIK